MVEWIQVKGETMSSQSKIFLLALHRLINNDIDVVMHVFDGKDMSLTDLLGGNISQGDIDTLRMINFSDDQKVAIRKLVIAISRLSALNILSLIDGIVMNDMDDLPDLSLVERKTGRNISDEVFLNEEFYDLINHI